MAPHFLLFRIMHPKKGENPFHNNVLQIGKKYRFVRGSKMNAMERVFISSGAYLGYFNAF